MLKSDGYHVHVYYELSQIHLAKDIRERMQREVQGMGELGSLRKVAVGPHPCPMFEAWLPNILLDPVMRWILENRKELSVMFHPLTGNDREDHEHHSIWIGKALPLRLEIFD